jgi:Mn2+/Fe2+ NRAMP family transporter
VFATVAVFILQSFTAATGILGRQGLAEAIRTTQGGPVFSIAARVLVVLGLWIGCASFELGNLVGAASGLANVVGGAIPIHWYVLGLAVSAGVMLLLDIRVLIRVLSVKVAFMGVLFFIAACVTPIDWSAAVSGMVVPSFPKDSILKVAALIGTTVVTYNLFLHASTTREFWQHESDARRAWFQELKGMAIFIPLGGVVSLAIMLCGASLSHSDAYVTNGLEQMRAQLVQQQLSMANQSAAPSPAAVQRIKDMTAQLELMLHQQARGEAADLDGFMAQHAGFIPKKPNHKVGQFAELLEPVAGPSARYLFGLGLLAAGLTSAITAPLAAAAGISELFSWQKNGTRFKLVWLSVLLTAVLFSQSKAVWPETSWSPLNMIIAAQAANGLLLPLIAAFMLYLAARQKSLSLPRWYTALGALVTIVCAGVGFKTLLWVWGQLPF